MFGEFELGGYYGIQNASMFKNDKFIKNLKNEDCGVNYDIKVGTNHDVNTVKINPYVRTFGMNKDVKVQIGLNVGKSW